MRATRFNPADELIFVRGLVWGRHGRPWELSLVFDPGAALTVLAPDVLDHLGYSAREAEAITKMSSAVAEEPGYLIRVSRFRALGHEFANFRIHAHDLPEYRGIHGLLGLNFLRQFNYEVRSQEGRILAERIREDT